MAKYPDPANRPLSPPLPQNPPPGAPKPPVGPSPGTAPSFPAPPSSTPSLPPSPSPTPPSSTESHLPPLIAKQNQPLPSSSDIDSTGSSSSSPPATNPPPPKSPPVFESSSPPSTQPAFTPPPKPPSPAVPNITENPITPLSSTLEQTPSLNLQQENSPPSSLPPPPAPPPAPSSTPATENPNTAASIAEPSDIKKSPFKKIFVILLGLAVLTGVAFLIYRLILGGSDSDSSSGSSGTRGSGASTSQNINLDYWGLWAPQASVLSIFQEFEEQNPGVKITYTQQSPQDYRERLQSALAKGTGPDIFRFHNTWVPMLRADLDQLPTSVMNTNNFEATFYPVAVKDLRGDSSFYGIPLMIDGLGLYYNKQIFANSSLTPPTSWNDLRKVAAQLTIRSQGKIERAGIALGNTSNTDNYSDILGLMLLQNKADPANPTSSLAVDALNFYTMFVKDDKVWDDTLPPSTFAFATERVAMMIAPSWRAHEVAEINPQLQFAIVPVPQLPDNDVITWASYWVEGVSKNSDHREMAWKFLSFLSTKDTLRKLYTQASNYRLFGEPFSRMDMADQLISDPYVGAYIQQAPKAQSWYMSSRTFDNGINDRIIKYYEDAINASNSGRDPAAALQTTSQGILQILSQYSSTAAR